MQVSPCVVQVSAERLVAPMPGGPSAVKTFVRAYAGLEPLPFVPAGYLQWVRPWDAFLVVNTCINASRQQQVRRVCRGEGGGWNSVP